MNFRTGLFTERRNVISDFLPQVSGEPEMCPRRRVEKGVASECRVSRKGSPYCPVAQNLLHLSWAGDKGRGQSRQVLKIENKG